MSERNILLLNNTEIGADSISQEIGRGNKFSHESIKRDCGAGKSEGDWIKINYTQPSGQVSPQTQHLQKSRNILMLFILFRFDFRSKQESKSILM